MMTPPCQQCGSPVKKPGRRFCGRSCSNRWQHAHGVRKGGFPKKIEELWLEKYGAAETERRKKLRDEKRSRTMTGSGNHFFGKTHNEEFRKLSSQIHRGKRISPETKTLMSLGHARAIASGVYDPGKNFGKSGWYHSSKTGVDEFFSSSYEERRMKFLDENQNVVSWTKKHGLMIPYILNGETHHYTPDFLVEWSNGATTIEEVKGWVRDYDEIAAKGEAARRLCSKRGWVFTMIFQQDLEGVTC